MEQDNITNILEIESPINDNGDKQQKDITIEKKVNYFGIILALITVISVFLPWVAASSSAHYSSSYGNYNGSYNSGGISGIYFGDGILGLLIAIVACILFIIKIKWAFIPGVITFILGLAHILGWSGIQGTSSYNSSYGSVTGHIDVIPQYGLIIFTIASFFYMIFALFDLLHMSNTRQSTQTINIKKTFCGNCGIELNNNDTDKFCEHCGTKI